MSYRGWMGNRATLMLVHMSNLGCFNILAKHCPATLEPDTPAHVTGPFYAVPLQDRKSHKNNLWLPLFGFQTSMLKKTVKRYCMWYNQGRRSYIYNVQLYQYPIHYMAQKRKGITNWVRCLKAVFPVFCYNGCPRASWQNVSPTQPCTSDSNVSHFCNLICNRLQRHGD